MIKTVALAASVVLNVLLLVVRIQVSVANTQTQAVKQDLWSVNNNQNVNVNVLLDSAAGKLVYTNVGIKTSAEFRVVSAGLTAFQRMFMSTVYFGDETIISYPVFVTPGVTTKVSSVTTNYNDWHRDWFKINIK